MVRTRVVTTDPDDRIIGRDGPPKYYVFRNLGPGKVTVSFWADISGNPTVYDIASGDSADFYCKLAEVKLANGERLDSAVLQWAPVD